MRTYRQGSHTVFDLKVHLVWITKYRYRVLTQAVGLRVWELLRQTCEAHDIEIMSGRVSTDHVHLYVSYPPDLAVSELMRRLKGRSSRRIQEEFPQLGQQ